MEESLPASFCRFPFFNLMINARGDYLPCCKYQGALKDHDVTLNAETHTLEQAFQSTEMKELREKFLAGKKPVACKQCWAEEAVGIRSMRFDGLYYQVPDEQIKNPTYPTRMDLYPSNACNLACRICGPSCSTSWIEEARESLDIIERTHLNLPATNVEILNSWLPNLQEIGLFGGEPLYQKEVRALLKRCVETGNASHIQIVMSTNTTIYSKEVVDWLLKFKQVFLNFSIDDIEKRFEYQRKNANWTESVYNVTQFVKAGGFADDAKLQTRITTTVSSLNVYYLPELFEWVEETFPGIPLFLNFLFNPEWFQIRHLHPVVKEKIEEKLRAYTPKRMAFDKLKTRTIEDVIQILHEPGEERWFDEFFVQVRRGDNFRKESFAQIFPEFYAILKPYDSGRQVSFLTPKANVPAETHTVADVENPPITDSSKPMSDIATPAPNTAPPAAPPKPKRKWEEFAGCGPDEAVRQRDRLEETKQVLARESNGPIYWLQLNDVDEITAIEGPDKSFLGIALDQTLKTENDFFARLVEEHGEVTSSAVVRIEQVVTFGDSLSVRVAMLPKFNESGKLVGTTIVATQKMTSPKSSADSAVEPADTQTAYVPQPFPSFQSGIEKRG